MDRRPFAGQHRGGQPTPQPEEVRQQRVKIHPAMRLATVQIQRHREDSDLGDHQQIQQHLKPAKLQQATGNKIQNRRRHYRARKGWK